MYVQANPPPENQGKDQKVFTLVQLDQAGQLSLDTSTMVKLSQIALPVVNLDQMMSAPSQSATVVTEPLQTIQEAEEQLAENTPQTIQGIPFTPSSEQMDLNIPAGDVLQPLPENPVVLINCKKSGQKFWNWQPGTSAHYAVNRNAYCRRKNTWT